MRYVVLFYTKNVKAYFAPDMSFSCAQMLLSGIRPGMIRRDFQSMTFSIGTIFRILERAHVATGNVRGC